MWIAAAISTSWWIEMPWSDKIPKYEYYKCKYYLVYTNKSESSERHYYQAIFIQLNWLNLYHVKNVKAQNIIGMDFSSIF